MTLDEEKLQRAAAEARARVSGRLNDVWWSLFARGLLALTLGLIALVWPKATLVLLIRLVGLYVLFDGIVSLYAVFRAREPGAYLVPGLISIAIGLVLLFWPDATGKFMLIVVGAWALFQGVILFLAGRQTNVQDPERNLTITIGVVAAIAGLILIIWPGAGAVTISWVIGIAAILIGALLSFLAMRMRQMKNRVSNPRQE